MVMQNEALALPHPIDRLELYELDPGKWDWANPPELFLVDDPSLIPPVPYRASLWLVEVEGKENQVESIEDGKYRYFFKLTCAVNGLWRQFFENYRGQVDVEFDGDRMILRCAPEELQSSYDEICQRAIPRATNDYRKDRDALVW